MEINFDDDYLSIYNRKFYNLLDIIDTNDNTFRLSKILDFDNKNNSWTKYDHYIVYHTFFGKFKDDNGFNYILKLPRDEMIQNLKSNVPDSWEIYLKIIDYYLKKN